MYFYTNRYQIDSLQYLYKSTAWSTGRRLVSSGTRQNDDEDHSDDVDDDDDDDNVDNDNVDQNGEDDDDEGGVSY